MNRLRNRLILVFAVATMPPLLVTAWVALSLLHHSLAFNATGELDRVSKSLEKTGRELYQRARQSLKDDSTTGKIQPQRFEFDHRSGWPAGVAEFSAAGDAERFVLAGDQGDRLDYLVRHGQDVWLYSEPLHVPMDQLTSEYKEARSVLEATQFRDLQRGFTLTFLLLAAAVWLLTLIGLIYWAHRISRPIQQLTTGLSAVAAGNLDYRVVASRDDEIGTAIQAFNHMSGQLRESRDRLVYVARLESWQALARKMAHEIKNSLTPIRLTMEEIAARRAVNDGEFLQQATQIVVDEVLSLERRVRAFSEFGGEPPVSPKPLDVNALLEDRVSLLKAAHPEVTYSTRLAGEPLQAYADEDLVKGVLTNLLENAAHAVAPGGVVLGVTTKMNGSVVIEIHDSGPGLNAQARTTLFEPTISFKRDGMGLGLSIARKGALLSGGDIQLVDGELGGAAFRVLLPAA
jgi:two-component system, NtrC family, nitrogen regulation sensor histidine kinase NtrY